MHTQTDPSSVDFLCKKISQIDLRTRQKSSFEKKENICPRFAGKYIELSQRAYKRFHPYQTGSNIFKPNQKLEQFSAKTPTQAKIPKSERNDRDKELFINLSHNASPIVELRNKNKFITDYHRITLDTFHIFQKSPCAFMASLTNDEYYDFASICLYHYFISEDETLLFLTPLSGTIYASFFYGILAKGGILDFIFNESQSINETFDSRQEIQYLNHLKCFLKKCSNMDFLFGPEPDLFEKLKELYPHVKIASCDLTLLEIMHTLDLKLKENADLLQKITTLFLETGIELLNEGTKNQDISKINHAFEMFQGVPRIFNANLVKKIGDTFPAVIAFEASKTAIQAYLTMSADTENQAIYIETIISKFTDLTNDLLQSKCSPHLFSIEDLRDQL